MQYTVQIVIQSQFIQLPPRAYFSLLVTSFATEFIISSDICDVCGLLIQEFFLSISKPNKIAFIMILGKIELLDQDVRGALKNIR